MADRPPGLIGWLAGCEWLRAERGWARLAWYSRQVSRTKAMSKTSSAPLDPFFHDPERQLAALVPGSFSDAELDFLAGLPEATI